MRVQDTEVLIAGAGPVGLMTAALLTEAGIKAEIIDREERTAASSYACGLHASSLALLQRLGLAGPLVKQGRRIRTMAFYDGAARRAEIDFSKLSKDFPFLLVLPQSALEAALERWLRKKARLAVHWNHRFDDVACKEREVVATVEKLGGTGTGYIVPHWETVVVKRFPVRAQFLIGADGHRSLVRQRLGIECEQAAGPESYAVIEFTSDIEMEDEVRVVLDETTTGVLWPLPDNRYRWSFQLTHSDEPDDFPEKSRSGVRFTGRGMDEDLRRWVQSVSRRRAPWFKGSVKEIAWCVQVGFQHRLARRFGQERCWLAGDAAHQTGPVGVQSMNAGLLEAESLAGSLEKILRDEAPIGLLESHNQEWRQEWSQLLGMSGGLHPTNETGDWVRERCGRMLSCLPASGKDLMRVAQQLGLELGENSPKEFAH